MTKATAGIRRCHGSNLEAPISAIVPAGGRTATLDARDVRSPRRGPLPRFFLLYVVMYAAYGVASPFFPAFLVERGVDAAELGIMLGAATAVRLLSAPLAARAGEALGRIRGVLVASVLATTIVTLGFLPAHGFWPLFVLALLAAAMMAPINVLADALALAHARPTKSAGGFEYGWVRGAGSAAFVAGMLLAGHAVTTFGLAVTIKLQVALLAVTALSACLVPRAIRREGRPARAKRDRPAVAALLRSAPFRRLVLIAGLLLGSHALQDAFAIIRWTAAGIGPKAASVLWSESVASEVLVFLVAGPALVSRLTPAGAIALAAGAGALRWAVSALTPHVALLALIQPLHGLTFALFHLSAVRLITRIAPPRLEATALAIYATAAGTATALLTLVSGGLYAWIGGAAFWVMVALSVTALLLAWRLRERAPRRATARVVRSPSIAPLRAAPHAGASEPARARAKASA